VKLVPVAPIGKRKSVALVKPSTGPCMLREIELDEYPPSPDGERFREARHAADLSLRECARELGLRPSEVSDLENGRAVPADGWDAVITVLRSLGDGTKGECK
jgi:DNA-binding transcriptional regulator YiaG